MTTLSLLRQCLGRLLCGIAFVVLAGAASAAEWSLQRYDGNATIELDGKPIADYVWNDEAVRRPYLRHLRTPSGIQVTRNQPPVAGSDIDDHPTFHPGVWTAFGDLSGVDFWRGKGLVRQLEFRVVPSGGGNLAAFEVRNAYEGDGRTVCHENVAVKFFSIDDGYVVEWASTFHPMEKGLTFGDQEEMGFGLRVASPLAVVRGGEIINSDGARNGKEAWGKQADWCAYRGTLDGRHVGLLLVPDPRNFRRSWFHARDYGLLVANPFGQRAFTKSESSRVVVEPGESLTLRFAVVVFDTPPDRQADLAKAYDAIVRRWKSKPN